MTDIPFRRPADVEAAPEYHCRYVDHTFVSKRQLGADLDRRAVSSPACQSPNEVVLSTCLRRERYMFARQAELSPGHDSEVLISGLMPTLTRLARIAAGAESMILGERFVASQVESAFAAAVNDPLRLLARKALDIAALVRRECSFSATRDYDDIAFQLLRCQPHANPRMLIVVGGGMLAQALCGHREAHRYESVRVVTRSAGAVRARVPKNVRVSKASSLLQDLDLQSFDCLVATRDVSARYAAVLSRIWSHPLCHRVIDLSSSEVATRNQPPAQCVSSYDPIFEDAIREANTTLAPLLPAIRNAIAWHAQASMRDTIERDIASTVSASW